MGRIQKKKTSTKAKKKKQQDEAPAKQKKENEASGQKRLSLVSSQNEPEKRPEEQKRPAVVTKSVSEKNILQKGLQFLREVKVELKKVTWPSRKQTLGSTLVVIILVMVISLFLGVVDIGLSGIIRVVLQ
ncbi:MAG TPA: preprotein translocase subunit SecE [Deltaproteobacteria bacterium]|nr:preprotein translocase subunit SecE [Deltaproteobacteria bacterium]